MALHDLGHVPFDEPFPRLRLHGDLLHEGRRMSKSRGNVVNPDDYVERYGTDVFRLYLAFCSRWDEGGDFRDDGIVGVERFVGRLWRRVEDSPDGTAPADRVVEAVDRAYPYNRYKQQVAPQNQQIRTVDPRTLKLLDQPLAPYLTEELWCRLGGRGSVHTAPWPTPVSRQ
jgi:leucyl-tRNA synthetase